MKRGRAALLIAVVVAVLAGPASALAYTDNGSVRFTSGRACSGCTVTIHNVTTGANGSTTSNSSGSWSAGGFVAGYTYQVWANYYLGSCSYASTDYVQWGKQSFNMLIDTIHHG